GSSRALGRATTPRCEPGPGCRSRATPPASLGVSPLVPRSRCEPDPAPPRRYVHVTMRYSLMFSTVIAVVMAANPEPLLRIPYPADYAVLGAPALAALALGNVAFSVFAIAGTILNGAGHTRDPPAPAASTPAPAGV